MSQENKALMGALLKVQLALPSAKSNKTNPHLKNRYADLAAVQEVCRPLLLENGLVVTHTSRTEQTGAITVTATMTHAETGESITSEVTMKPQQDTPQGIGSCLTYGRRYTLAAMVGIVVDDDDDGNAASKPAKAGASNGAPTIQGKKNEVNALLKLLPKESKERAAIAGEAKYLEEQNGFTIAEADKMIERLNKLVPVHG